jgi:hypothetical protein
LTIFGKTRAPLALFASTLAAGVVLLSNVIAACTSLSRAILSPAAAGEDPKVTPMRKKRENNLKDNEYI